MGEKKRKTKFLSCLKGNLDADWKTSAFLELNVNSEFMRKVKQIF